MKIKKIGEVVVAVGCIGLVNTGVGAPPPPPFVNPNSLDLGKGIVSSCYLNKSNTCGTTVFRKITDYDSRMKITEEEKQQLVNAGCLVVSLDNTWNVKCWQKMIGGGYKEMERVNLEDLQRQREEQRRLLPTVGPQPLGNGGGMIKLLELIWF